MPRETAVLAVLARLARIPIALRPAAPFVRPRKVLILKPDSLSQVMLTTPLLAALSNAFPDARFDWAISDWARPAIATNPRVTELIRTGPGGLDGLTWSEVRALAARLRRKSYDTCFIPSRSAVLAYVAWRADIPQRVGLNVSGRGFAHTTAVTPPATVRHASAVYLSLAGAVGIDRQESGRCGMEFYPPDADRTRITRRLIDELGWLGDVPLVVVHPGGGVNPVYTVPEKRWPAERFSLLCNDLVRRFRARILLIGDDRDRPLAEAIAGMVHVPVTNWAGQVSLGEVGAVSEMASLYIGNDAGPTHVAAAVGCPTLVLFGPSDPPISAPCVAGGRVKVLWHELGGRPFSWRNGVTVEEAVEAAASLLSGEA
ncbi:MAG: glycosyltransferase family 9 protein [Anaerolineae bacterium]